MNLITRHELAKLSLEELRGLYRKTFNKVSDPNTVGEERRNALATLQNVAIELAMRS